MKGKQKTKKLKQHEQMKSQIDEAEAVHNVCTKTRVVKLKQWKYAATPGLSNRTSQIYVPLHS